ncbi:hypothetical protein NDU88_000878 [Pleurodeles waltl]|uniref:Uncharacterized protein n=1 Tax=Pleurodeles waltl TaxID=8319 RepID=A0AAV7TGS2_PLEWA|nr:hypothetical protein NDU88_000878 [Pleurodeles waltl]
MAARARGERGSADPAAPALPCPVRRVCLLLIYFGLVRSLRTKPRSVLDPAQPGARCGEHLSAPLHLVLRGPTGPVCHAGAAGPQISQESPGTPGSASGLRMAGVARPRLRSGGKSRIGGPRLGGTGRLLHHQ